MKGARKNVAKLLLLACVITTFVIIVPTIVKGDAYYEYNCCCEECYVSNCEFAPPEPPEPRNQCWTDEDCYNPFRPYCCWSGCYRIIIEMK